jgi:hypothetical protein
LEGGDIASDRASGSQLKTKENIQSQKLAAHAPWRQQKHIRITGRVGVSGLVRLQHQTEYDEND